MRSNRVSGHSPRWAQGCSPAAYITLRDLLDTAQGTGESPLMVLLDGIEDPQNLGAIIRTAECAGAIGVVVPDRRAAPLGLGAMNASAGAAARLPVARVSGIPGALETIKREGYHCVAADMDGRMPYYASDLTGPTAIVIGGEDHGVGRLSKELCDEVVRIPMFGRTPSLNASVSAAILMYEAVRQRAAINAADRRKVARFAEVV